MKRERERGLEKDISFSRFILFGGRTSLHDPACLCAVCEARDGRTAVVVRAGVLGNEGVAVIVRINLVERLENTIAGRLDSRGQARLHLL